MNRRIVAALSAVGAAGVGLAAWNCMGDEGGGFDGETSERLGSPLSGAIFTTTADGSVVNGNLYEHKEDVYLDGGPGMHAPARAAGLPPGDYFFQVTDPSGHDLLSSDHVSCRRVRVNEEGVIDYLYPGTNYLYQHGQWTPVACQHVAGTDADHPNLGAITAQLMPYDDTPNPGGVYKVWMTRVEDYLGDPRYVPHGRNDSVNGERWEPGYVHGFVPSASKTDNFKARHPRRPPFETPRLSLRKWHDADLDGVRDAEELEIEGWRVTVADPVGSTNSYFTPASLLVTEGLWTASEEHRPRTLQTAAWLDGVQESDYPSADPIVAVAVAGTSGETHEIWYGNVGLGLVRVCKRYDRDADGAVDEGEPPVPGWTVELTGTTAHGDAVGPLVRVTGRDGCAAYADLLPGRYRVVERVPGAPWHSSGETAVDVTITSTLEGGVLSGTARDVAFTNYCTATFDFDTKGYWHNRNGLAELTPADLTYVNGLAPYRAPSSYFGAGDEPFDGRLTNGSPVGAVPGGAAGDLGAAGTPLAEVSQFLVDSNAGGDPREQLAQQLLAFIFNVRHRIGDPGAAILLPDMTRRSGGDLIAAAIAAWSGGAPGEQTAMAGLLDRLNNSDALECVRPTPCSLP